MHQEEKKLTCQICDVALKDKAYYEENFKNPNIMKFCPSHWQGICSYECQELALEYNACWRMKNKLKNMASMPFVVFQEAFKFPEAGGYAHEKHEKMCLAPHLFINMLDKATFRNFVQLKE